MTWYERLACWLGRHRTTTWALNDEETDHPLIRMTLCVRCHRIESE